MDAHAWDERYADQPNLWGTSANQSIVELVGDRTPGVAVDLACGDGRHASWLAGLGWTVQAVDFSPVAIEQARKRPNTEHDRISWIVGDAADWAPSEPVDLVVVAYLHLVELPEILERALTWVEPDGEVVYVGHAKENLSYGVGGPSDPSVLPDVEYLASGLTRARIRHLQHFERLTDNGVAVDLVVAASPWPRWATRRD